MSLPGSEAMKYSLCLSETLLSLQMVRSLGLWRHPEINLYDVCLVARLDMECRVQRLISNCQSFWMLWVLPPSRPLLVALAHCDLLYPVSQTEVWSQAPYGKHGGMDWFYRIRAAEKVG